MPKTRLRIATILLLGAVAAAALRAQQQEAARSTETVSAGVRAVLVDVVVRDKKGQPVRDLTQSDFEVFEDGAPQQLGSFTRVFDGTVEAAADVPGNPVAAAPTAIGSSAPIDAGPSVTALVFDRLTPDARKLAVHAAEEYFGSREEAPGYVGIFGIDLSLTPYAPFTRSVRVLRQGLDRMSSRASASFNSPEPAQQKASLDQQATAASQAVAAAGAGAGPGTSQAMGTGAGDAILAQMQSNMIQDFQLMERDQQGYATTNGLFAIVSAMRRLPGRKSLVLFSEGISIPPAVQRLFFGVIDAANRANVSIYAMDAAGLRAESEQAKIRDVVNRAAGAGTGVLGSGVNGDAPLTRALENNEDVLRQDPHNGLGELAQETGGLLFENTNNLRPAFDRIEDDLRNYYLLGYTPTNDAFDGKFRTIDVRVKRPGVTVAARKGYFAVRGTGGAPINPWEAPALGALEQKPVPNTFPVRAAALSFPERDRPGLTPVIVDLKTAPLSFQPAGDGKTYTSDFTVLVRFLDSRNQVIRKISQHYEVNGPLPEIGRARDGEVLFYREPDLPAGVYSMESVVYDAPSGKSSVRLSTVEVPKIDTASLRMSSLVLVKRAEKVAEKDRRPDNPLMVDDVVLYPNLGEPVSKTAKEVGFYFVAYPAQGPGPEAVLELLQNGKAVAQVPLTLRAPDAAGRIRQAGRLPLDAIPPDTYEFRVTVKQGGDQIYRSAMLRIVE